MFFKNEMKLTLQNLQWPLVQQTKVGPLRVEFMHEGKHHFVNVGSLAF